MTATADRVEATVTTEPVTMPRVVKSEWIKFRTLRSSVFMLIAAVLGMVVIGLLVAYNTRHLSSNLQPDDLVASSTLQGYYLGQLLIGALGVLFVSGEFGTGMIRSTFAAVPTRWPVLVAKIVVFVAVVLVTMEIACLVAFLAAQGLISNYRTGYSLGDPGALRVVLGTGLYLTLVGLIGSAIGWLVRNTPGSLVTYFAVILVIPVLFSNVLGTWGKHVAEYLPSEAGRSVVSSLRESLTLSPLTGLVVLLVWVVVATVAAALSLNRRDA